MALEHILVNDANGVQRKITVDVHDTDLNAQVLKMGFAADGSTPVLASSSNPLPIVVIGALPAGSNVLGNIGLEARISGGLTISRTLSAASTNATLVKASAGQVYGWYFFNANAATRYLKLYNKSSAPAVGTDTPVMTIPIPAGAAANCPFPHGIAFSAGIAFALTTGIADADTGAVAANDLAINLLYK